MNESNDPRVFFAAERTLLAWIRTGLAVMGMGFVVARFELTIKLIKGIDAARPNVGATVIGCGLVFLGAFAMAMAARQHLHFCRTLGPEEIPRSNLSRWTVLFASALSIIGVMLALYIVSRSIVG